MPQEPRPAAPTGHVPPPPPRPLQDELKALPGADAPRVRSVAWRLARHLGDVASFAFFVGILGLVARGLEPLQRLLDAFRVADRARGKVEKPGAILASTWSGWVPPVKPSDINRPVSSQAPPGPGPHAVAPHEVAPPRIAPPPSEEELREERIRTWTIWAKDPRHPYHKIGKQNLAADHAGEPAGGGP